MEPPLRSGFVGHSHATLAKRIPINQCCYLHPTSTHIESAQSQKPSTKAQMQRAAPRAQMETAS